MSDPTYSSCTAVRAGRTVRAVSLSVGDQIAAAGGALWTVRRVEIRPDAVTVTLFDDTSPSGEARNGIQQTLLARQLVQLAPVAGSVSSDAVLA